jgi:hypothetical protein
MDEVSLFDHVSDWSLEQIAEWFERWYESTNPGLLLYPNVQLVVDMFHWCDQNEDLRMESLMNDKPLYLSDYSSAWNMSKREKMTLHKVTCTIKNPLAFLEQGIWMEDMEKHLSVPIRGWEKATGRQVDALIYTPHPYLREPYLRQMKLLYPQESIRSIVEIGGTF